MKITKIIIRKLFGTINFDGQFWEERLVKPVDIYKEYEIDQTETKKSGKFLTESIFIEIYTDNDLSGIADPIDEQQAFIIEKNLSKIILGKDPLAIELLWDQMHRLSVHGRQGITMQAISAIDCALWDIKGKYFNTPVYNLIGGGSISFNEETYKVNEKNFKMKNNFDKKFLGRIKNFDYYYCF